MQQASQDTCLSTYIHPEGSPTFPCVKRGEVDVQELKAPTTSRVRVILTQTDFQMVHSSAVQTILSSGDRMTLTYELSSRGIVNATPSMRFARRARNPIGVPSGVVTERASEVERYMKEKGLHPDCSTPRSTLGITDDADSVELIAKYGSIVASRIAIQNEETDE